MEEGGIPGKFADPRALPTLTFLNWFVGLPTAECLDFDPKNQQVLERNDSSCVHPCCLISAMSGISIFLSALLLQFILASLYLDYHNPRSQFG